MPQRRAIRQLKHNRRRRAPGARDRALETRDRDLDLARSDALRGVGPALADLLHRAVDAAPLTVHAVELLAVVQIALPRRAAGLAGESVLAAGAAAAAASRRRR